MVEVARAGYLSTRMLERDLPEAKEMATGSKEAYRIYIPGYTVCANKLRRRCTIHMCE